MRAGTGVAVVGSVLHDAGARAGIGRIVTGCLVGGLVVALALVIGPVAGAQEHVITGTILLTFAASWALLGTFSMLRTAQPQRWAFALAGFMALAGVALLVLAPSGLVIDALGWVWPPLFLALLAGDDRARPSGSAQSRSGCGWCTRFSASTRCVLWAAATRPSESRSTAASSHRANWLMSVDTGCICAVLVRALLPSCSNQGSARRAPIGDGSRRRSHSDTRVCVYDRAGRGWSDPVSVPQDGVAVATDLHILLDRAHVPGPFVLVGHSSGAQYVRIFAGRYPEQVAGMVLLDGQPPKRSRACRRIQCSTASSIASSRCCRRWLGSASGGSSFQPTSPCLRPRETCSVFTTPRRASIAACATSSRNCPHRLAQARSFQSLGDRPLVVVTAARGCAGGMAAAAGPDGDAVDEQQPPRRALHP